MAKKNILSEAIADANELRATALANAKIALTESFTPSLQRLVSTRIQEEDEEGEEVDIDLNMDEEGGEDSGMGFDSFDSGKDEDSMELESLMRELDGEDEEMMEGEEFEDEEMMEYDDFGEEDEEMMEYDDFGEEDEEMMEGEEDSWSDPIDENDEMEYSDDELEEAIGRVFEMDGLGDDLDMEYSDDELEEAIGRVFEMDGLGDDLDMGQNKEDGSAYDENPPNGPQFLESKNRRLRTENKRLKVKLNATNKKLNETLRANVTYKKVLNEVNLLNSKLMYNTKVLRKYELTEGQRERILNSFDRAATVREVELVYTTVCEAFNKKSTKTKMIEGLASRTIKQIKPNPNGNIINEDLVTRMQRLANIKKLED